MRIATFLIALCAALFVESAWAQLAVYNPAFAQPAYGQYAPIGQQALSVYELAAIAQTAQITPIDLANAIAQAQQAPFAITQIADPLGLDPVQLAQLAQQAQITQQQQGISVFQLAQQASGIAGVGAYQQYPLNPYQQVPLNPYQQVPLNPYQQAPLSPYQQQYNPLLQPQLGAYSPATLSPYQLAAIAQTAQITPIDLANAIAQAQQAPFAITQIADPLGLDPVQLAQLAQQAQLTQQQQGISVFQIAQQATYGFQQAGLNPYAQAPYQPMLQQPLMAQQPMLVQQPQYIPPQARGYWGI